MKNYGITLTRGNYETSGRQNVFSLFTRHDLMLQFIQNLKINNSGIQFVAVAVKPKPKMYFDRVKRPVYCTPQI